MTTDRSTSTRRRALSLGVCALLALGSLLGLGAASAMADAGNPIAGTTQGEMVQNPDGTVSVYVRGQWNWLSHKTDCNTDRAGAGLSMVWNDSTETGYTLSSGVISAQVGVGTKDGSWADPNPIDGMVHPADLGNVPAGLPGLSGQTFSDPAPQAAGQPHPTETWRGGCGREPLSHVDSFTGHPWGSWGFDKESLGTDGKVHLGYSHVYRSSSFVPKTICVNFYDVHGGDQPGKSKFQVPQDTKNLDVLANDDNSIETNAYNVNGGSCAETSTFTSGPPAGGGTGAAKKAPPRVCKLRKARARVFVFTRHNKVRLVIRYVAYTKATITTSYTLHGSKGSLFLGKATQTFKKKGVFRLPKHLTQGKMNKVRAAKEFTVQFQIPGTPSFCKRYFKRKLTIPRYIEGQRVWFQSGSVFGGDV